VKDQGKSELEACKDFYAQKLRDFKVQHESEIAVAKKESSAVSEEWKDKFLEEHASNQT
jgi:F0F1-type ATP synthase membrane subunit b/b'